MQPLNNHGLISAAEIEDVYKAENAYKKLSKDVQLTASTVQIVIKKK